MHRTDTNLNLLPLLWKNIPAGEISGNFAFPLIKGKRTPLSFRLILSLSPDNIVRLMEQTVPEMSPEDVQGLYLNLKFDGMHLTCITGTSFRTFTMDKSLEHAWDEMVKKYFLKKEIEFEIA